jgi:hypothetical protein
MDARHGLASSCRSSPPPGPQRCPAVFRTHQVCTPFLRPLATPIGDLRVDRANATLLFKAGYLELWLIFLKGLPLKGRGWSSTNGETALGVTRLKFRFTWSFANFLPTCGQAPNLGVAFVPAILLLDLQPADSTEQRCMDVLVG